MFLTDVLALSHVPRWSIVPHLIPQSVSDHSFRVAMIAMEIIRRHEGKDGWSDVRPHNVLWHSLIHDVEESITGDLPSGAKKFLRTRRDIGVIIDDVPNHGMFIKEMMIVKLADLIEAYTFIAMTGVGSHSVAVGMELKFKIDFLYSDHVLSPIIDPAFIVSIINDIMSERGRLRPVTSGV